MIRRPIELVQTIFLIAAAAAMIFFIFNPQPVLFFNRTTSMPRGIYVRTHTRITANALVVIPTRTINSFKEKLPRYLLKQVMPYNNETVTINARGLFLDNKLVAKRVINQGISYSSQLPSSECILLGQSQRSFDSRYFGPVNISDLIPVRPWIIFY